MDLDPAQMQTFHSPLLDIAYVLLLHAFNHVPRLLATILAVPHAIAAVLALVLAHRLLPPYQAFAAALIGVTGAAGLPTLGTAMSEMAAGACILGAVLLLIRADGTEPSEQACLAAGLLGGIAVGLKLTSGPYTLGLVVLPIFGAPGRWVRRVLWFAGGGVVGAGLTGGFWWWNLWQHFANPVFPYFNDFFHSPWGAMARMADLRFMPRSVVQALFYPLFWVFTPQTLVTELPTRDPRVALGCIAALAVVVRAKRRLHSRAARGVAMLSAFWALSYVAWEICFSILRYLAVLELFSGVLIMTALSPLLTRLAREWQRMCSAALVLVLIAVTVYPDWGRGAPGEQAVAVALPPMPADSLVVLLDPSPMAYVVAFAPLNMRFVGANNNLVHPGDRNRLARQVEAAMRTHSGPLWGLEMPGENKGVADITLRAYGLRRGKGCAPVRSNLDQDGILACPLLRISAGTPEPPAR